MAEGWNIHDMLNVTDAEGNTLTSLGSPQDTMGLASLVVDIAAATAHTVPALGQTGYEKIMPLNPGPPDYVVMVLSGYNHDIEPAPLKIHNGVKGLDTPNTFDAAFMPTSYQWGGWDAPVAVKDAEMYKWRMTNEQPEGHTIFGGDSNPSTRRSTRT